MSSEFIGKTIDKLAPTTGRDAEMLAVRHGFRNLATFAEQLPYQARVLDVGAGASNLGRAVTDLRSDVAWVNLDQAYSDQNILDEVSDGARANLEFVTGDVTNLTDVFPDERFDLVTSYWLLPHLSINERGPAIEAAKQMYYVTNYGGVLSVGPRADRRKIPLNAQGPAIKTVKLGRTTDESFAESIVDATELSPPVKYIQRMANEVITPYLGTTLHRKGTDIYDPDSGKYVSVFSSRGVHICRSLAYHTAKYMALNPPTRSRY